jgi:hypothetical protein
VTIAVFFPSLMGVGILVSGALLLADLIRKYLPQRGLRRRHRVAMGAFGVVNGAATWAGREMSAGELLERAPRNRVTYSGWAVASMAAAVITPVAAAAAYRDELGVFHASPWMVGLGTAGGVVFGLLAVFLATVAVLAGTKYGPMAWLIGQTALGRLQVPEDDQQERTGQ